MKESNNTLIWAGQKEWEPWTCSNRCPNCGGAEIEYNTHIILASYPPQSKLRCKHCGHIFSSGVAEEWTNKDAIIELWPTNQGVPCIEIPLPVTIPQIGDWPTPCDPPSYPDKDSKVGWICPKCSRVLAPHMDSCPYCSGPTTINITY